jgi:hypothetical protein
MAGLTDRISQTIRDEFAVVLAPELAQFKQDVLQSLKPDFEQIEGRLQTAIETYVAPAVEKAVASFDARIAAIETKISTPAQS